MQKKDFISLELTKLIAKFTDMMNHSRPVFNTGIEGIIFARESIEALRKEIILLREKIDGSRQYTYRVRHKGRRTWYERKKLIEARAVASAQSLLVDSKASNAAEHVQSVAQYGE